MEFDISIVLNIALSMFLVMVVGYYLRKIDLIDAQFSKKLSKLVLHVTQPVLIVSSMIKMAMSLENLKFLGIILVVSIGAHTLAAVMGYFTMCFMKPADERKLSEHSIIFANVMFFGLPVVSRMFGTEAEAWASFFSIAFHIYAWTYGLIILGRGRDDIKLSTKKVLLNFGTIPCLIGIVLYLVNAQSFLPVGVTTAMSYIGGLCTPISLLVLGGVLATYPIKSLFCDWKVYYVCFVKLIVFPLVVFLLAKYVLCLSDNICMFTMIMCALPTASITNMFAELYGIKPGYAATCVGMTTAVSVLTLPLMVYIAGLL